MYDNLVLLVADDLDRARKTAQLAGETARKMPGAGLSIIVAYPAVPDFLGRAESERATARRQARAEAVAEALRREVGTLPGRVDTAVLEGSLTQAARAIAQTRGNDLVVLGPKGLGLWGRLAARFRGRGNRDRTLRPVLVAR